MNQLKKTKQKANPLNQLFRLHNLSALIYLPEKRNNLDRLSHPAKGSLLAYRSEGMPSISTFSLLAMCIRNLRLRAI
jgi:hypothetical protein